MTISLLLALASAGAALPPPQQPPVQYRVKAGETLLSIADRWFVTKASWPTVQRLNKLGDPRRIPIGKMLLIPRDFLKAVPIGAKVFAFRGDVSIDGKMPVLDTAVREGSTIVTGADASVTVECSDGSRFSLPSQTRVAVARLRRILLTGDLDRVFATSRGRGEWQVSPAPTAGSRFMVTTPVSVSAVRGTGFRVGYEGAAAVGVVNGTVGVSGGDPERATPIPKGKGVAVAKSGVGKPVDLLPAPELLQPGATQAASDLFFAIAPVAGAKSYVVEVGTDAGLTDRVRELRGATVSARLPGLPDGSYFVRTTATDRQGIDGFAKIWAFERLTVVTPDPEREERGTRFRWSGGEGKREYRFTLYADEAATRPLIDRTGMLEQMITVTDLKPATYWWRVSVTKFGGAQPIVATGELQSFTIVAGD